MTKKLSLVFIALTLSTGWAFSQSRTFSEWQTVFDADRAGGFSFERQQNLKDYYIGPLMHTDISDMYWEAFSVVNGHTYAWLASGDNTYLDYVLDVVQRDIENADNMSTANPQPQLATYRGWNFNAFLAKPNFFGFNGTVSISNYINNANPETTGYGRRTNANGTSAGTYIALDEGMYNRNIAQLARVMHNNIGSIGNQVSNNGQTYQQRLNVLVAHLRDHVWARNFENPNIDNSHYFRDVYRVNTHMSSHLAMVALCLYVIEGDQKYLDFVEQFLYDFDQVPAGFKRPTHLTPGQGFLDKLEYQPNIDAYWWAATWNRTTSTQAVQDEGHAVAELQLLKACYEEGIGLNPPDGEPVIDLQFMTRIANAVQWGYLNGYECSDGSNLPFLKFRLDRSGRNGYGLQSALSAYAEFSPAILCYLEYRTSGIDLLRVGQLGAAMYTSRVLGVGGDAGPVYTPNGGGGVAPDNFRPNVVANEGSSDTYEVGDVVVEGSATWNDVEDGTGTILVPTRGSVPKNGSNEATTPGTYVLEYDYTDAGGLTGTGFRTITVNNSAATRPNLMLSYSDTTITQFSNYTPPTYSWTDAVDGSGTTGAIVSDGGVDPDVVGTYTGTVAFTNSSGLTDTDTFTVRVVGTANVGVNSIVLSSSRPFYMSEKSTDFPAYTIYPINATNLRLNVTVADPTIVEVQESGEDQYQFLALQPGITTFTLTSQDNPSATVSGTVVVQVPNSIITIIIQND